MMQELRAAIEGVLNDAFDTLSIPPTDGDTPVSVQTLRELENQYRLYFVEPEEDHEFQSWKNA